MGKKVVLCLGVIFFALTLSLAACGKSEEKKAPPPPAPAAPAAPAGGAPGEPGAVAPAPAGGEKAPGAPEAPAAPGETKSMEKKAEGAKTK